MREGVVHILRQSGFEVVGAAGDATELGQLADTLRPDVVVTDIQMPPTSTDDGLQAARRIRSSHPEVAVVVLSQYLEAQYPLALLSEGTEGVGYLLKERLGDVSAFTDAVRRVAEGGSALDPEVVRRMVQRPRTKNPVDELDTKGAGSFEPDGRGAIEPRDRGPPRGECRSYRAARNEYLCQITARPRGGGPSPRTGRPGLPPCSGPPPWCSWLSPGAQIRKGNSV